MMDNARKLIIKNHPLSHIRELKVDPDIFTVRFANECSMMKCSAACCRWGVWADTVERDNILGHGELIRQYMDPGMEKNPGNWFDPEVIPDIDFSSGTAIGTAVNATGCVFLNNAGLCVLQKVEMGEKDPALKLKPFYCKAFPITVENGILIYDDYMQSDQPQCCSAVPGGELNIFDVLTEELELVLGKEGLEELKEQAKGNAADYLR